MSKIRVGVLRGGPSSEYDVSLKTGAGVLSNLPKDKYEPVDIFIDKDGVWHLQGAPRPVDEIGHIIDVAWNALHGEYGEDGQIQEILETYKIPYTGSGPRASLLGMNKMLSKRAVKKLGVKVPFHHIMTRSEYEKADPHKLFRSTLVPVVIKPLRGGSSVGTSLAQTMDELWEGIEEALNNDEAIMLEQYIRGKEATVGVVDEFRGQKHYALIPIEIKRPNPNDVWNYEDKYSGATREICPGHFTHEEKRELERLAILAHKSVGARHYSRSDFIVSPRGIYFLEINTLPGLTSESLVPKALSAGGTTFSEFLHHVIGLALA